MLTHFEHTWNLEEIREGRFFMHFFSSSSVITVKVSLLRFAGGSSTVPFWTLKLISSSGAGSTFLLVPWFHCAVVSVQLAAVSPSRTATSTFQRRAPTWLQDLPFPAMQEQPAVTTSPLFFTHTQAFLAVELTAWDGHTDPFR